MAFQNVRGTRDFPPQVMIKREYLLEMIRAVFEDYGFQPLQTPALESWELLSNKGGGGEEVRKEIYCFKDKGGREVGLRFDLTVPFSRFVADNPQVPKPFKRYQVAPVWRYDNPQAGRYREFWQADADIVGSERMESDAECIALAVNVLRQLGFRKFKVRLNNRKILSGIIEVMQLGKGKASEVMRVLDKFEKIGEKEVRKELGKTMPPKRVDELLDAVGRRGSPGKMLKGRAALEKSTVADEGVNELRRLVDLCKAYGVDEFLEIDFSLIRGLDYYTGPIFEISIESAKGLGSVAGGGRYDGLVEAAGGKWTPATGVSIGVERIFEIMEEEKMFDQPASRTEVFIVAVDDSVRDDVIRLAQELRAGYVNVETDLMGRDMKRQLAYAGSQGIPYAVIVGTEELKKNTLTVRDMRTGKQGGLTRAQVVKRFGKK